MTYYINPKVNTIEKDIVKGTVLGGSTIVKPTGGKNCYLSMRCKDGSWLDYKAYELRGLSSQEPVTIEKTNRWHSLCYPIFNEIRKSFWDGKERKIQDEMFPTLSFLSHMVWFGDVGTYKNGIVTFNTHIWGEEGTNQILNHFKTITYAAEIFMERKKFRVKFDTESSYRFIKSISPLMPRFMAERLSK